MKTRLSLFALSFLVLVPRIAAASEVPLVSCLPDGGNGQSGDNFNRAFYVGDFPASNLGKVSMSLVGYTAGAQYDFTLIAHDQTFDGLVLGSALASVTNAGPGRPVFTFDFRGAPTVPHHTVAFVLQVSTDGGVTQMDTGLAPCPATQTEDSTPPLSTFRRDSMGVNITTYGPEITMVNPAIGSPTGGSHVTINSSFVGEGAIVTFGGSAATGLTIPDGGVGEGGTFGAVTPGHAEGEVDVDIAMTYANDAGIDASASASLHNGYFYGSDVIEAGPGSDSGASGFDASTSRADSGSDNGATGGDDSGCGCDLPGVASAPGSFAFALIGLGAILRRRGRR